MTLKALISDGDGVVFNSEILYLEIALEFFRERGWEDFGPKDYDRLIFGKSPADFRKLADEEHRRRFGTGLSVSFVDEYNAAHANRDDFFRRLEPVAGIPGVYEALACPLGFASNSGRAKVLRKFEATNTSHLFEPQHIHTSTDIPADRGKPEPDLFLLASRQLLTSPEECVSVEDSPSGALAARRAGTHVAGFIGACHRSGEHADELLANGAHVIIEDDEHLGEYLENLGLNDPTHALRGPSPWV